MVNTLTSIENTPQNNIHDASTDEINADDNPNNLPYFEENVLTSFRSKNYHKCIKTIERILKVTPKEDSTHYRILQAASYTMLGKDFKKSHSILDGVLKRNSQDSFALYGKATAFYFQGDFDKSIEMLDRAIEANDSEEMKRARDLKMKIEMERKKARIVLKKLDFMSDGEIEMKVKNEEPEIKPKSKSKKNQRTLVKLKQNNLIAKIKTRKSLSGDKNESGNDLNLEDDEDSLEALENSLNSSQSNQSSDLKSNRLKMVARRSKRSIKNFIEIQPENSSSTLENFHDEKMEIDDENSSESTSNDSSNYKSMNGHENQFSNIKVQNLELESSNSKISRKIKDSVESKNPEINEQDFKNSLNEDQLIDAENPSKLTRTSSNSPAEENFNKGLDVYMAGNLRKSLKYFEKALKLEPNFEEADEMGTKVQELLELMDLAEINLSQKNYEIVVQIITQALEVDDANDTVNKILYFKRGLAYFHLRKNDLSLLDYAEFERLKKKLGGD